MDQKLTNLKSKLQKVTSNHTDHIMTHFLSISRVWLRTLKKLGLFTPALQHSKKKSITQSILSDIGIVKTKKQKNKFLTCITQKVYPYHSKNFEIFINIFWDNYRFKWIDWCLFGLDWGESRSAANVSLSFCWGPGQGWGLFGLNWRESRSAANVSLSFGWGPGQGGGLFGFR